MTTIYLIRHAEAEGNLYRIAQGHNNAILTTRGWKQVALLRERFAQVHIDAVHSSDLYRTCATASAIFEPHNLPLQKNPALREICVGTWEGKTWGQIALENPTQLHNFTHDLINWDVEEGESAAAVIQRIEAAVRHIAKTHPDQTVAVFSHGYAIRLFLAKLQGYGLEGVDKTPTGENTAVTCLDIDGDAITVRFRDDVTHLAPLNTGVKRATAVQPGLYFTQATAEEVNAIFPHNLQGGTCLLGHRQGETVGYVQLLPEKDTSMGWIGAMYLQDADRNLGYGAQLLGQSIVFYRNRGVDTLSMDASGADEAFFQRYGFVLGADGVWMKENKFDPRYL